MADDKGAPKSVGWDAFEIVLVILLTIGLLNRLQGKPTVSENNSPNQEMSSFQNTASSCGLFVSRPHPLEKIQSFLTLSGDTSGCNWPSTQTVALYAQVIDSRGMPVSAYTIIPPNFYDEISTSSTFNTTIGLNKTPSKGTGYLILIPAKNDPRDPITNRIPITF